MEYQLIEGWDYETDSTDDFDDETDEFVDLYSDKYDPMAEFDRITGSDDEISENLLHEMSQLGIYTRNNFVWAD